MVACDEVASPVVGHRPDLVARKLAAHVLEHPAAGVGDDTTLRAGVARGRGKLSRLEISHPRNALPLFREQLHLLWQTTFVAIRMP